MQAQHRKKIALALLAGGLWLGVVMVIVKNDQTGSVAEAKGKSSDQSESKGKSNKANLSDYEAPNTSKGTTNASLHQAASRGVVAELGRVSGSSEENGLSKKEEKTATTPATGSPALRTGLDSEKVAKVKKAVEVVVADIEAEAEETAGALEAVETRGKVKTLLLGTDYKNLGKLRSSLVHNRNDIRKLTQALALAQTDEEKVAIQASLEELMGERERIRTVITDNEEGFSLFGWVSRFLTNYEMTPINTTEEDDLTTEVEDAIGGVNDDVDTTTETTETTETPTDTETDTTTETPAL